MKLNLLSALLLAGVSIVSAKDYRITIDRPTTVAGVELKPGQYTVSVDQTKAVVLDSKRKSVAEAEVTVSEAQQKAEFTTLETSKIDGKTTIKALLPARTKTRVEFK